MTKRIAVFLCALAAAFAVHAQTPPLSTTFDVTVATPGPTATNTTYTISVPTVAGLGDFAWQFGQVWRAAQETQASGQFAIPTCLVDSSAVDNPPQATRTTLDWTTYKLRFPQDGSVLSVTPMTGAVYRDAVRQGNAVVQKLCVFGASIYGKGKASGTWFKWVGVSATVPAGWATVPTDVDATVLN